jgi:hypothetical protein
MSTTPGESLSPEFLRLQAEARHARERYQLYKARTFPGRIASGWAETRGRHLRGWRLARGMREETATDGEPGSPNEMRERR